MYNSGPVHKSEACLLNNDNFRVSYCSTAMTGETADQTEGVDCEIRKNRGEVQVPIASDIYVKKYQQHFWCHTVELGSVIQ